MPVIGPLDDVEFSSYDGFNGQLVRWRYEAMRPWFVGSTCLELGSSDGQGTAYLIQHFPNVVAVDGSIKAITSMRARFPIDTVEPIHGMFEDLDLGLRFDTIVAAHVLEHVADPSAVLAVAREHLAPGGHLIVDVPNAMSLHRQLGVAMGMLPTVTSLNAADLSIGHQRVFTSATFYAELDAAGFRVLHRGGIFLKVLSNAQTAATFDDAQLSGFLALGERYPELAAELLAVVTHAD